MGKYDWKKALDYILYVANQKEVSQASLAEMLLLYVTLTGCVMAKKM